MSHSRTRRLRVLPRRAASSLTVPYWPDVAGGLLFCFEEVASYWRVALLTRPLTCGTAESHLSPCALTLSVPSA